MWRNKLEGHDLKERDRFRIRSVDERIILMWILKCADWITQDEDRVQLRALVEHVNEILGSMQNGEFLD
jgi:hypothetical protein